MPLFQDESSCKNFLMNQNKFALHKNEPASRTHFHMNGFALSLNRGNRQLENGLFIFLPLTMNLPEILLEMQAQGSKHQ